MITKEQEVALHQLECDTHSFWSEEVANTFTRPFGFDCYVFKHKADGNKNPKGLTLNNGAKEATGVSSVGVSDQIARHVGATPEAKMGRGFQVRANCAAIRKHLNG